MIADVKLTVEDYLSQAVAKHKEGQRQEAIDLYLKSLAIEKSLPDWVYENIVILLSQQDQFSQALDLGEKALKIHENSDKVCRVIGLTYNRQGDFDKSISCYLKSLSLNRNQPNWLYSSLIAMLIDSSRLQQAVKVGKEGIKLYGDDP